VVAPCHTPDRARAVVGSGRWARTLRHAGRRRHAHVASHAQLAAGLTLFDCQVLDRGSKPLGPASVEIRSGEGTALSIAPVSLERLGPGGTLQAAPGQADTPLAAYCVVEGKVSSKEIASTFCLLGDRFECGSGP